MAKIEKVYKISYILSNGKTLLHPNKRSKAMIEWNEVLGLSAEEVAKYLKLGKGKNKEKYKDAKVVEMKLLDWVNNVMVSKSLEIKDEVNEKEL